MSKKVNKLTNYINEAAVVKGVKPSAVRDELMELLDVTSGSISIYERKDSLAYLAKPSRLALLEYLTNLGIKVDAQFMGFEITPAN